MDKHHEAYLRDLRSRHEAECEALRIALAGRRPRALREMAQRHRAIEKETERVLAAARTGNEN